MEKELSEEEKDLFIWNQDMNDIKIIISLEDSGVSFDGATEIVKHETKKEGKFLGAFLVPLATSLV